MASVDISEVQGTILDDCSHEDIDADRHMCRDCGVIVGSEYCIAERSYSNFDDTQNVIRKTKRVCSLFSKAQRDEIGFSPDIIDRAEDISRKFNISVKDNRSERRTMRQVVCLFYAHNEMDIVTEIYEIARKVNLPQKKVSQALSLFSPLQTGYTPGKSSSRGKLRKTTKRNPIVLIAISQLKRLGLEGEAFKRIERIITHAIQVDPSIAKRHKAATSASAAVSFYLDISNYKIDAGKINTVIRVSDTTLKTVKDKIATAYNKRIPKKK